MATTRNIPNRAETPGFGRVIMVDAVRGRIRFRKWPSPTGPSKSPLVRLLNDRFRQAQRIAKSCDASQIIAAMIATKGSGLYPRDLLTKFILNGPLVIVRPDGREISKERPEVIPVTFQGARAERSTAKALPAGANTVVDWDIPVIDTAAMLSASTPTRITIPAGVTRVRIEGGMNTNATTSGTYHTQIRKNGALIVAHQRNNAGLSGDHTITSGPMNVVAGDYFELVITVATVHATLVGPATFISAEILQAA